MDVVIVRASVPSPLPNPENENKCGGKTSLPSYFHVCPKISVGDLAGHYPLVTGLDLLAGRAYSIVRS